MVYGVDIKDLSKLEQGSVIVFMAKSGGIEDIERGKVRDTFLSVLSSKSRPVLVVVGSKEEAKGCSEILEFMGLMSEYGFYDIYFVESQEIVDETYLKNVTSTKQESLSGGNFILPDITEIRDALSVFEVLQEAIASGSDKFADVLNKVEEAINVLPGYYRNLVGNLEVLSKDKVNFETVDTKPFEKQIEELTGKVAELLKVQSDTDAKVELLAGEIREKDAEIGKLRAELSSKGEAKAEPAPVVSVGGNAKVTSYIPLNLKGNNICKVPFIFYFKELSPVHYLPSFLGILQSYLISDKKKVKLVVYDNAGEFGNVYGDMPLVTGSTYVRNKDNFCSAEGVSSFVVLEPTQNIIKDLVSSEGIDILIIYDRLKFKSDIVVGNNVTKFYTVGSYSAMVNLSKDVRISRGDYIITNDGSALTDADALSKINSELQVENVFDLKKIADYNSKTAAAKKMAVGAMLSTNGKSLIVSLVKSFKK